MNSPDQTHTYIHRQLNQIIIMGNQNLIFHKSDLFIFVLALALVSSLQYCHIWLLSENAARKNRHLFKVACFLVIKTKP